MSSGRSKLDPKRPFVQGDAWPQVSIVVRCRNEKSALPRLFSCIRMQQYPGDIELILVDSGSTDGTRELSIPSFARWLDIAPEEFTWGRALNLGCSAAKGEILVLLSAHTFPLERTWLRALIQPFREAGVALVHGRQVGDARINSRETAQLAEEYPPQDIRGAQKFSNANGALPMALYRENPFDEDFQIGEEIPLVRFAIDAGFVVHYSAEAAVEHAHAADAAGEYRRWFWKGYVFEKHIYRGKKRNSLPVFTLRYLYSLGKSSLLMLRTGAWREIAALPRLEWLKGLAFRRGIQAARREEERGPDFSQVRYGELELPPSIVRAKPRRTGHPLPRSDAHLYPRRRTRRRAAGRAGPAEDPPRARTA
jgi:glycosyltransferase involved in cell wall biosynthesis